MESTKPSAGISELTRRRRQRLDDFYRANRARLEGCMDMRRIARRLLAASEGHLRIFELGGPAVRILLALQRRDIQPFPSDMARAIGIRPSTMSNILRRMEEQQLITREPRRSGTRHRRIRLTTEGETNLDVVMEQYYGAMELQMSKLSEDEVGELLRLLRKVDVSTPPPPQRSCLARGLPLEEPFMGWAHHHGIEL